MAIRKMKKRLYRKKRLIKKRSVLGLMRKRNPVVNEMRIHTTNYFPVSVTAVSDYTIGIPLNFPGYYRNNLNTYGACPNQTVLLGRAYNMFDMYRVLSVRIKYEPNEQWVATAPDSTDTPNLIYMVYDGDDITNVTNELQMLQNCITPYNSNKTVSRTFKNGNCVWLNTALSSSTPTTAAPVVQNTLPANVFNSVKILMPQLYWTVGTAYHGRFYIQWEIEFKDFRETQV